MLSSEIYGGLNRLVGEERGVNASSLSAGG